MKWCSCAKPVVLPGNGNGRRLTHEKISLIPHGPDDSGGGRGAGVFGRHDMVGYQYDSQKRGFAGVHQKMEAGQEDTNATVEEKPETVVDAPKTPEQEVYQEEKPKQDERIVSAFQTLNAVTSPGELDFTNPNIAILMSEMRNRWNYLQQREGELNELETHLGEQLQA